MTQTKAPSNVWSVTLALGKASLGLLNPKIWLLSLLPFAAAGALWSGIAYVGWDAANEMLRAAISGFTLPSWMPDWLPSRTLWIPLVVLTLTLPAVLITALVLVGLVGTGATARRIGNSYGLQPQMIAPLARGASLLGSVWHSVWVLSMLAIVWFFAFLLYPLLGVGVLVQLMVLAWANARLFSRDVLLEFADSHERDALLKAHRGALWSLGLIASVPAAIPSIMLLGGAMAIFALPVMALLAVWLYVMIFLATSLLFSHFLLPALKDLREQAAVQQASVNAQLAKELAKGDVLAIDTTASEVLGELAPPASPTPPATPALNPPAAKP
jgi:Etoposide-induced protein 2.4 (EI24)